MAFIPIYRVLQMVIARNGATVAEGNMPLMLVNPEMEETLSEYITNDDVINMPQMIFRKPAGTNPSIVWGEWEEFVEYEGDTSIYAKTSPQFLALFETVGDQVTFYNKASGPRYAFGFKYIGDTPEGLKKFHQVFIYDGSVHENPGTDFLQGSYYSGGSYTYYDFMFGVTINQETYEAMPFVVRPFYHKPAQTGDSAPVYVPSYSGSTLTSLMQNMYICFMNVYVPSSDPYTEHADPSEPAIPDGSYDDSSDAISLPSVPALNLSLSHFMSAYSPSVAQLNDLADWLWGDYAGVDRHIAKFFADPTDAIISLHMLPFTPDTSTDIHVTIGQFDTLQEMPPVTAQFKDIDCGSLDILPYWDNYLDCNPYTRYTLVLPFVGEVQLDPDEILRETVSVLYRVDVLSGAFVCFVKTATKILAQYAGNCSLQVPVSSASYAQANAAILRVAMGAVGMMAGGVSGAAALSNTAEGALTVSNSKVNHSHSGSIAGTAGFLGTMKPYLLIHRASQCVPAKQNQFGGYPLLVTGTLGDFAGWTSVESIILDGIPFTLEEVEAFRQILHDGIII